ncbi:MAG TPA: bifunctional helix-turn-helix transcriptional regulator/GNAT family N-acetyltransferase [Hyphomicrobiaceae bacterium]|jgi:DNA-binding MarR family transcriptional regulator/GNAT superfamily N-acetyltransferase|nr:bifunctional helix-turn-helix transcriptional regulator/GNAT family N-acetyltransferase [Hyphomicrobiaceae bacterium]
MDQEVAATTEAVRRFNRFYTRRIGVLEESLLGSGLTLSQARIVFELGRRAEWTAGGMAADLGLDPGYVSRLLAGLEKRKLIARRPSPSDGRQAIVSLTARGRERYQFLDQHSTDEVSALLAGLSAASQRRLLVAMTTIEALLEGAAEPQVPYIIRPPRPGDIGWVVSRHGALYAEEYGWDETFEGFAAEIAGQFIKNFDARRERCWIAEREGALVGAVFLVRGPDDDTAKLRMLYVEPAARGLGIGRRLVEECRIFARTAGYARILLWTNSILTSARRIYETAGYRLIESEAHRSFGHDLVGETWELELGPVKRS